jgi:hypothetical protein
MQFANGLVGLNGTRNKRLDVVVVGCIYHLVGSLSLNWLNYQHLWLVRFFFLLAELDALKIGYLNHLLLSFILVDKIVIREWHPTKAVLCFLVDMC